MHYHLFHLLEFSPWPLLVGVSSLNTMTSLVVWFNTKSTSYLFMSSLIMTFMVLNWFRDITRESNLLGKHSFVVKYGFQLGMVLFIFSEVMFFMSFFWTFFHSSLTPTFEIGVIWPPFYMEGVSPFEIPLLNTLILLSSGVTVTWSHYLILQNKKEAWSLLMLTILLGVYFTSLQVIEYSEVNFSFTDSVFGSVFFMATGFHGLHVIIGSILLVYALLRMVIYHFSLLDPIGFELAIWYWHFVDVVWLFLFSFIYWWGY